MGLYKVNAKGELIGKGDFNAQLVQVYENIKKALTLKDIGTIYKCKLEPGSPTERAIKADSTTKDTGRTNKLRT